MGYLRNLVHKDHDFFLKDFGCDGEAVNEAESKDGKSFLSWQHGIHVSTTCHVLRDNGRASISESQDEQVTNLLNGVFQDGSFKI
jgi:hypothetical protein